MGVRIKRIAGIGVKVYACGLYVNPASARAAVGDRYVGKSVKDVAKDQALFDAVNAAADVEKTVRLVFARDIDSAKIGTRCPRGWTGAGRGLAVAQAL